MKTTFISLAGLMSCIAMLFAACSDTENLESQMKEQNASTRADVPEMLTIHYNGNTYENVPTTYDENGDFVFHDKVFAPIYNRELANDSALSINVKSETEICLYKSLRENIESCGYNYDEIFNLVNFDNDTNITRGIGYENLAILEICDDENYGAPSQLHYLTATKLSVEDRRLKYSGFNDKCSSLRITNNMPNDSTQMFQLGDYACPCSKVEAVFFGFEDKDFAKKTIIYIASAGTQRLAPKLPGFNDKLSSFRFLFARNGQYKEQ